LQAVDAAENTKDVIQLLSGVLHPRVVDALAAFLPGLFFESCVLLASPQKVHLVLANAQLDRPAELFVAFLFAFIVGNGFMFWVRMLQVALLSVSGTFWICWPWLLERKLVLFANQRNIAANRNLQPGQQPSRSLYFRIVQWAYGVEINHRANRQFMQEAWGEVATALLGRYGLPKHRRANWAAWTNTLGTRTLEELRGLPLISSMHATGWAGLAATYLAPNLMSRPFEYFCVFLIFSGLLHAASVASWAKHPVKSWLMGLRNTFEELRTLGPPQENRVPAEKQNPDSL
jgi:hypothetical protein